MWPRRPPLCRRLENPRAFRSQNRRWRWASGRARHCSTRSAAGCRGRSADRTPDRPRRRRLTGEGRQRLRDIRAKPSRRTVVMQASKRKCVRSSTAARLERPLLAVRSPHLAEHVADLAERAVRLHCLEHRVHEVLVAAASVLDGAQLLLRLPLRAAALDGVQPLHLLVDQLVIDFQRWNRLVPLRAEGIYAHDLTLAPVDLPLPLVSALPQLALRVAPFDVAADSA